MSKTKSRKKRFSPAEKKAFRKGFLSGLFRSKKKKVKKSIVVVKKKHSFSSIDQIPYNNQHNVLFDDERYRTIRDQLHYSGAYGYDIASDDLIKDSLALYKRRYGDSVLKKHYGIK